MEYRILGPLEVMAEGRLLGLGRRKQRAVLAILLVHANGVVGLDRLVEELWGEEPPPQAIGSLQAYVSHLRRLLEPGRSARTPARVLLTQPPGYRLVVAEQDLDASRFQVLAGEGHRLLEAGEHQRAAVTLAEGVGLWRGPVLADFPDAPFVQAERARLEELRLVALEDRATAELALGRHATVAAELEQLVAAHPLREGLHGLLMLALYRSGRQAEALEAYQAASRTLREELGIDPGPGPAARYDRSVSPTCKPSSPTSTTTRSVAGWHRHGSAGGGDAGAGQRGPPGRLSPGQVAAGPGGRVGGLEPDPALAAGRHPRGRCRWGSPWQPAGAQAEPGGRRAGSRGGRLGAAVQIQPGCRRLAARGRRRAAHRPAARPAGAAGVGGPARPGRSRQPGQPRPPGDRAGWGVRDRLQAVSRPPAARPIRAALAWALPPRPCTAGGIVRG